MLRRSQGTPTHSFDLEIDRTLRQIRRLYREESRGFRDIVDSDSEVCTSNSQSEAMDETLFREFGNSEDYEFT